MIFGDAELLLFCSLPSRFEFCPASWRGSIAVLAQLNETRNCAIIANDFEHGWHRYDRTRFEFSDDGGAVLP